MTVVLFETLVGLVGTYMILLWTRHPGIVAAVDLVPHCADVINYRSSRKHTLGL